ncbi:MAG: hypothetical protein ABL914_10880 [Novosphingobium sp.]|uniref:hypothetical protein n=1 Tax=Novosphingobium sp. TaxID=1874826 RepID=UPI0032BBA318
MSEWFQIAVIGFIVLTIGWHAMRTARANPQDTGTLGQQLSGVEARLGKVEGEVRRLDNDAASKADVKRVEKELAAVRTELAAIGKSAASREATLDHVKEQVDRMLDIIMKRGL